jgi:hypothetical protein
MSALAAALTHRVQVLTWMSNYMLYIIHALASMPSSCKWGTAQHADKKVMLINKVCSLQAYAYSVVVTCVIKL